MSTSNTAFPNPNFPVYSENTAHAEVAGVQLQGSSAQGSGLGVLVLPKGEVITILPSAPSSASPQVEAPVSKELVNQAFTPTNVRVLPPAPIRPPENSISFDGAIINEIKTVRAEWRERKKAFDEEEEPKKKKNKFKSSKSKKGSPLKLSTKATVYFEAEKNSSDRKPEGFSKKKTKKTSAKSIFPKTKR